MRLVLPLGVPLARPSTGRSAFRGLRIGAASSPNDGKPTRPTENGGVKPNATTLPKSSSSTSATPAPPSVKVAAKETTTSPKVSPKAVTAKPAAAVKTFSNINNFVVPVELRVTFDNVWKERKALMEASKGFVELKISDGRSHRAGREVTVASSWSSIPDWEAYSCSDDARRSQLPPGIYQYVPKRGEGFPEDFTPFVDFSTAVNAKY